MKKLLLTAMCALSALSCFGQTRPNAYTTNTTAGADSHVQSLAIPAANLSGTVPDAQIAANVVRANNATFNSIFPYNVPQPAFPLNTSTRIYFYEAGTAAINNSPYTQISSSCWTNGDGAMIYENDTLGDTATLYTSNRVTGANNYYDIDFANNGYLQESDTWGDFNASDNPPIMLWGTNSPTYLKTNIFCPRIEIFGDSNSGTTNPIGQSFPNPAVGVDTWPLHILQQSNFNNFLPPIYIYNWAISGGMFSDADNFYSTNYPTDAADLPQVSNQPRYVIIPPMLANDIASGTSIADIEAQISNLWARARSDHYIIIMSTGTGDCQDGDNWYNTGNPNNTTLTNINAWILSQSNSYDYFVDGFHVITTNNIMGNSPHWNMAGQIQLMVAINNVMSNEVSNWAVPASSIPKPTTFTTNLTSVILSTRTMVFSNGLLISVQ